MFIKHFETFLSINYNINKSVARTFPDKSIYFMFQTQTKYSHISHTLKINGTNSTITEVQKVLSSANGANTLGKR